jgi:hypothetical protein
MSVPVLKRRDTTRVRVGIGLRAWVRHRAITGCRYKEPQPGLYRSSVRGEAEVECALAPLDVDK